MPELPEVETIVRGVRPQTVGREIQAVLRAARTMTHSSVGRFSSMLMGRSINRLDRHGKWMFFRLSGGDTMVVHLGMTGRLSIEETSQQRAAKHTHLQLLLSPGETELHFADPRRFGRLLVCDRKAFSQRFGPSRLGPDALTVTRRHLADRLGKTRRNLKAALLDQQLLAGIGNIYADEILFEARIDPRQRGCELELSDVACLHRAIGAVLRKAIRYNGTSIRDYVTGAGVPGQFQQRLRAYGRANQPCKNCSTPIELLRTIVSGRATYWCPSCQQHGP